MTIRSLTSRLLLLGCTLLPATPLLADVNMGQFSLSRAAPADAFITVCSRTNPERAFLDKYWQRVIDAFWESDIHIDLWDLITERVPENEIAKIEELRERFETLCHKVDWSELANREFLYSARLSDLPMPYEGLFAGRLANKEAAVKNHEAITAIFNELAKYVEAEAGEQVIRVTSEARQDKTTITKLNFAEVPFIEIAMAQKDDMILLTFGKPQIMQDALANLSDSKEAKRIVDTERFKGAFAQLPDAEDEFVFFDIERMMLFMRQTSTMVEREIAGQMPEGQADGQPKELNPASLVTAFLNDAAFIDYMAVSSWTEGFRVMGETIVATNDKAISSPLLPVIAGGGKLEAYGKFIPADATSFSVSSGISLSKGYDYLINFVKQHVPNHEPMLQQWDGMQQQALKLDIKKDILDLFGTESVSFTMGQDWVSLTQVTDSKKADAQVERVLNQINGMIKQQAGERNALILTKVKVGPEAELTEISHGMMMMVGITSPPVVGCADGYLIMSSSADAVRKCLLTGKGKANDITTNSRWRQEGLEPKGDVVMVAFTDQSNMASEMKQAIGGIGTGLSMTPMFAAGQMPPEVAQLMGTLGGVALKLIPVADKMNFFKSNASYTTWDGKVWHTYAVQNYKKPQEVMGNDKETETASAN